MSNMFIHVVTYQALQPVLEQTIVANGRFFLYAGYNMVRLIGHIVLCFVFVFCFFSLRTAVDVYAGACSQAYSGVAARS